LRSSGSADWATSACNTRGAWGSRLSQSTAGPIGAELSKKLGAHHYIDSDTTDVARALQERGGAQVVLATASGGKAVAAALGGLRRGGVMISLGATDEPIELSAFELLFKQLSVDGALTGTPEAGDATLKFSVLSHVAAMIETMPLERAAEAYARMMSGKARFRMVLTME
jgi:propanol-preferring alcohol dehydrogenase